MPRRPRKPRQPSYRLHKPSGQAVVTIDGKDHYLGRYDSPDSHREYIDQIAKWRARLGESADLIDHQSCPNLSVNELLERCWDEHFSSYYAEDGKPTTEAANLYTVIRLVSKLYGMLPAKDFGPRTLKEIRRYMIEDLDLCRNEVNKRVGKIKRIFKHAVSEQMIPVSVFQALQTVTGLRQGKCQVRETEPVKPVPDLHVCLVLPFVARQVASMIITQRLTGMRPGEVVIMRGCDINMVGEIWEYRPKRHKNQWRGHDRIIPLGPFAQQVLKPFLTRPSNSYLFSPIEAEEERNIERRRRRRTPLPKGRPPKKRKAATQRAKRDYYDRDSYRRAIEYGMKKAKREGIHIPHWHPHQLRHNHGTGVREVFGIEEAFTSLGTGTDVVEIYAERNRELAVRVARRIG